MGAPRLAIGALAGWIAGMIMKTQAGLRSADKAPRVTPTPCHGIAIASVATGGGASGIGVSTRRCLTDANNGAAITVFDGELRCLRETQSVQLPRASMRPFAKRTVATPFSAITSATSFGVDTTRLGLVRATTAAWQDSLRVITLTSRVGASVRHSTVASPGNSRGWDGSRRTSRCR